MGNDSNIKKKYKIPLNKKLNQLISTTIKTENNKFDSLIKKNIKKIKPCNFSKVFNQNEKGINNICSLINLIYVKNANSCLKIQSNITFYETIFNIDYIEYNKKENDNVEDRKNMKGVYEKKNENEKNIIKPLNEENDEIRPPNKTVNEKNIKVPFDEEINNYLNNAKKNTTKINYDFDNFNISQTQKKHNKNPKTNPVVIINFDLSELYKLEVIEKQLYRKKEIKKEKKKISSKQKLKTEIENFTKTGIKPTNLNDGSFLEIVDYLNQIN